MEAETKIIAITGAATGLGRALARQLVSVGHRVILLGRTRTTLDKLASELGSSASVEVCDVSSPHSVKAVFDSIAKQYAVIDVLINNAAVYEPFFVKDATDEQISAAMNTNFAGPVYCSRAVIPLMKAGSHIVNISSETVGENHAMFSLYQSSKAGLERFTEALHDELNPDGIRVTLARAGQMMDADSRPPVDGEVARRFAEENLKRGLDFRARPISAFTSAAKVLSALIELPDDLHVPHIILEARRKQ